MINKIGLFIIPLSRISLKPLMVLFLVASLFFLPLSSTGKSIFVTLSLITILLIPEYSKALKIYLYTPWYQALLLFFAMVLVACFWSPADLHTKFVVLEKYSKLLYLPILIVGFKQQTTRVWGLHAFLLAMLITALISILKTHGFLTHFNIDPDKVFRNHIIAGLMSAFAAYLSLLFFHQQKNGKKWFYLLLTGIYSYHVLFINNGRTGYIIYIGLMLLLMMQLYSLKRALLSILCVVSLATLIFFQSPVMKAGLASVYEDWGRYQQQDKNTAVGFRLQFHEFAHQVFNQHPIFGAGTGGFYYYFNKENPVPVWGPYLLDPHSQYWLIASELGLFGLGIFSLFILKLFQACWKLQQTRPIALGTLFSILLGCYSDSFIFYSSAGYFFVLMIALTLSEKLPEIPKIQS